MTMTADRRIVALQDQQKELVLKWGPDVESVMSLRKNNTRVLKRTELRMARLLWPHVFFQFIL